MANSNLTLAMVACLSQRALDAAADAGCLSKSDVRTIAGLRAGGGARAAHHRMVGAIKKQFAERDQEVARDVEVVRKAVEAYARQKVQEVMPMPTLVERNVAKAADTQRALREAIAEYSKSHPGANRADVIDKILFSRPVSDLHQAEVMLKARNSLPQDRPGTMQTHHNDAPVLGRTGYSADDDDTRSRTPQRLAGRRVHMIRRPIPIVHDHNQLLEDIKSGKLPWNDPRASALVALERKRIFEKKD